jgi:hypothetical protein
MSNGLQKKLRLQTGQHATFVNLPQGILELIGPLPEDLRVESVPYTGLDFVLLFVHNSAELVQHAPVVLSSLKSDGLLWIAYPKQSSGLETDLNRDKGWLPITSAGYRGVFQIAINKTWSAVHWPPTTALSIPTAFMLDRYCSSLTPTAPRPPRPRKRLPRQPPPR